MSTLWCTPYTVPVTKLWSHYPGNLPDKSQLRAKFHQRQYPLLSNAMTIGPIHQVAVALSLLGNVGVEWRDASKIES